MLSPVNTLRMTAALAALILFGMSGATANTDEVAVPETYTWSAELIAFDEASRMATLRHWLVDHDKQALDGFHDGDPIVLTWSGFVSASGIRAIEHGDKATGRFQIPVEFAAIDGRDLSFRVPVPADYMNTIRGLRPAEWLTATSPHAAWDRNAVVMHVRGYTDVGNEYLHRVTLDMAVTDYTWSAKLLGFDEASMTATVRAMLVGSDSGDLSGYQDADRVVLTWSGITYASGIRGIAPGESGRSRFEMPVELAAVDGRYLTFRVPVPDDYLDTIRDLKPGQWVTATSPQPAPDRSAVVLDIREFNDRG